MRLFLSYLALLPAAILCYLPVIHHVRVRKTLLIPGGIPLFFWAAIGGSLGTRFLLEFYQWLCSPCFHFSLLHFTLVPIFPSGKASVFSLAVGAGFSTIGNLAVAADALIAPDGSPSLLTIPGCPDLPCHDLGNHTGCLVSSHTCGPLASG